jgi:hypothetical protein
VVGIFPLLAERSESGGGANQWRAGIADAEIQRIFTAHFIANRVCFVWARLDSMNPCSIECFFHNHEAS